MPLDLQAQMSAAIREAVAEAVIAPRVVSGLRPPERLAIHARNYRAGLTGALGETFPAVRRLIGEGFFGYAAAQFLSAHPPADPVVAHYGADFPAFLAAFEPAAALSFLADVARLEWALHALADTSPPPVIEREALGEAGDAVFRWSRSAALFEAASPAGLLLETDEPGAVDLTQPCRLLLTASDDAVVWRDLAPAGFSFLQTLQAGARLNAAIATALSHDPHFGAAMALRDALSARCFDALLPAKDALQ